jgi:transcriptional regulator with XRE-family HTH domain
LAERSGVGHSTISRLILGGRIPSLETATRLARVLPDLTGNALGVPMLTGLSTRMTDAPARVFYVLRSDEDLSPEDARAVMVFYLRRRARARADPPTREQATSE